MQEAINKIQRELEYPITEVKWDQSYYDVTFDPLEKIHYFYVPREGAMPEIVKLRNFCHSYLAEKVNPLFSAIVVEYDEALPERVFESIIWPIFCVSRAWFADGLMYELCPDDAKEWMRAKVEAVRAAFSDGGVQANLRDALEIALIVAEAKDLCGERVEVTGKSRDFVDAFIEVNPRNATVEGLEALNAKLLKLAGDFDVELVFNKKMNMHVWRCKGASMG